PPLPAALGGGGVAALARVPHEAHGLDGGVGGDLGADGTRAGDALAVGDESRGGLTLGGGDEVDRAQFVLATPAAPVGERLQVLADLCLRRDRGANGHERGPGTTASRPSRSSSRCPGTAARARAAAGTSCAR